ncbi:MAG: hypothetical protein KJN62_03825 [Deltaproteobacteria bacterium]|nr:hypothetical protein [Deltaproteobacteria bacterium]
MPTKKKIRLGILTAVAAVSVAIMAIWGFADKISYTIKEKYIIPCVDKRVDKLTEFSNDKIAVMYEFNMRHAKISGLDTLWNECREKVYAEKEKRIGSVRNE